MRAEQLSIEQFATLFERLSDVSVHAHRDIRTTL
jgi:hypothetical protein